MVVVGASVESGTGRRGGFGCELDAAMVAAGRLGCANRELCMGKKNKGGREGGVGRFGSAREAGQLGQRPRRSAGRSCRRVAVGAWRARAERSVSDGKGAARARRASFPGQGRSEEGGSAPMAMERGKQARVLAAA